MGGSKVGAKKELLSTSLVTIRRESKSSSDALSFMSGFDGLYETWLLIDLWSVCCRGGDLRLSELSDWRVMF